MKISLIAGARPNFMKIAPLARALSDAGIQPRIIHTGQHYDARMSETFFRELNIPDPDVNLGVGSGTHVWQISETMRCLELEFTENRPDAVLVVGDVNSTLAAALTATKLGIRVGHVEAGLRSLDRSMPEEINRVVTDSVSDWLFTSEPSAEDNLRREGVAPERIHPVGNVMIDTLRSHLDSAKAMRRHEKLGLKAGSYAVLTLHRPSNVDRPEQLESIMRAVHRVSGQLPVVFPIHPRTESRIRQFGFLDRDELNGFTSIEPQGYLAMLSLMESSRFVLTDSGGIQEETTALRVPCLTLRENTERPVTIDLGSNQLVGSRTEDILAAVQRILDGPTRIGRVPESWDGRTAERIARLLEDLVQP
ncbi:MAG TPA: UDP-N-acetylglucosamine 2-epimerase (non-hydrolyzing) [Thermoguttaceae bacterium]|nr:UDP-N-acetylglucosamine 2-epimerase (non-hydrolyzing) [Thermoguttaceae bacterium]